MADYFYLPTDFKSTLELEPRIHNVIADVSVYVGLDQWVDGLFFSMHAPITWSNWHLHYHETIVTTGTNNHDFGYFAASQLPRSVLLKNFSEYACGKAPEKFIDPVYSGNDIIFHGLCYGKFDSHHHTKTRIAHPTELFQSRGNDRSEFFHRSGCESFFHRLFQYFCL